MKTWLPLVAGVILLLVGLLWTFQGVGVIQGSFMSGQKLWFTIGVIVAIIGLVLLGSAVRGFRSVRTVRGSRA
jgi:uncharacterized integral membrane protein